MTEFKDEGLEPSSDVDQNTSELGMSDEDFLNMPVPSFEDEAPEETEEVSEVEPEDEEDFLSEEEDFEEGETEDDALDFGAEDETEEEEEQTTTEEPEGTSDYKDKYEELMAPFRANGKEIKVDSAEDLRRLAQMGVGYNAKMAALKPVRKIAKMLENEGLLDEGKISFLIDLSKNNPDAINKLVAQSGISPLDIDTESTDGYTPSSYTVDDKQLELDEALTDLRQSPTVQQTLEVLSTKWDQASRQKLFDTPADIIALDAQVQSGIFDQVMQVVERDKLLGKIPAHVSDLEAYNFVGSQMHAQGAFAPQKAAPVAPVTAQPRKESQQEKRNSRKRAAAPKRSKPTKPSTPTNVLSLSDEEFEKLMPNYL